jgi:hypothetical protein
MMKKLILAAALGLAAPAAFADNGWHRGHDKHWRHHARPVVVMPPPRIVYYAPPPVMYAPPPRVVYAPPAPVYYSPPPAVVYPEPAVSIGFRFRL